MRILAAFLLFMVVSGPESAPGQSGGSSAAGQRLALIIGNANYTDGEAPLKEPVNDARALSQELRRCGFDVDQKENLSRSAMQRALEGLYAKIKSGSTVFFFFSGYAVQSDRQNYLIPVDAHIWTDADVRRDGLSLDAVLSEISARGANVEIAVLDASRRNPFERRLPRRFSTGLAPALAPSGSLIMFSAAPGAVVDDAQSDRGAFVSTLIGEIAKPDVTANEVFDRTRTEVSRSSQHSQVPWVSNTLADTFSFRGASIGATSAVVPGGNVNPSKNEPSPAIVPNNSMATEIDRLDARIRSNPADVEALYKRGQLYAQAGDFARATKDFDSTLRINPRDVEALNNRCWSRAMTGELQLALKDCNEAIQLRSDFVDALDSRGFVNLKLGSYRSAIADYDNALRLRPAQASSLYGRGVGKLRAGSSAEGDADIAAAKKLNAKIAEEFARYGIK
jgi:tetratricopeptide (TPR) repeat protein